jgi:hypothetical protein
VKKENKKCLNFLISGPGPKIPARGWKEWPDHSTFRLANQRLCQGESVFIDFSNFFMSGHSPERCKTEQVEGRRLHQEGGIDPQKIAGKNLK